MNDPYAAQRAQLQTALRAAPGRVSFTYAELVRQQIAAIENDEGVLLPGLVCLKVSEALTGSFSSALNAATSLCLLGAMSRTYDELVAEGAGEIERTWGMPRTLNAMDAFYTLAEASFIEASAAMPAEKRLPAIGAYDDLCHRLSLKLNSEAAGARLSIWDGANLASFCAGTPSPAYAAQDASDVSLPPAVASALSEAQAYVTDRSRS